VLDDEGKFIGFDVIIGNPPYGAELSEPERNFIKKRHNINNTDTAAVFMKFSTEILSAKGLNSFIVPKPFVYASNWKQVQSTIINNLTDLIDCSKVWKEVKLEQVIYVYNNNLKSKTYNSLVRKNENIIKLGKINKKSFKDFGFILNGVNDKELDIAYNMISNNKFLNDICLNQRGAPLQKYVSDNKSKYKVIGGKEISKYYYSNKIKGYLDEDFYINDKLNINENSLLVQRIVAHLTKPIDHIKIIAISSKQLFQENLLIVDTINQLTNKSDYENYYILSLVNSKLVSWFSYRFIFGKAIRTVQFDNPTTSRIPIPNLDLTKKEDKENHDKLVNLVEQMLLSQKALQTAESDSEKKFALQKVTAFDTQIDTIVYKLYNLTEEEIQIVEEG